MNPLFAIRAKSILQKCLPQVRASVAVATPVRDMDSVGAIARARPMSIAISASRGPSAHDGRTGREFNRLPLDAGFTRGERGRGKDAIARAAIEIERQDKRSSDKPTQENKKDLEKERQDRGISRFQALFRGHRARKLFRAQSKHTDSLH